MHNIMNLDELSDEAENLRARRIALASEIKMELDDVEVEKQLAVRRQLQKQLCHHTYISLYILQSTSVNEIKYFSTILKERRIYILCLGGKIFFISDQAYRVSYQIIILYMKVKDTFVFIKNNN